jgi:hypothetical protein
MTQEERVSGGRHAGKNRINRQGSVMLHPMMKTELTAKTPSAQRVLTTDVK